MWVPPVALTQDPKVGYCFLVLCFFESSLIPPAPGPFSQRLFNKSLIKKKKPSYWLQLFLFNGGDALIPRMGGKGKREEGKGT